jgi:Uma2 family endonuclease
MYDLPSENQEEPGLPDIFHIHQPQLLRETFHPPDYAPENIFEASDLNLYYDVAHEKWYKRPDWFAVLGVPLLYKKHDMRSSYVIWQEEVVPFIVVELLSKDTEKEDLGKTLREIRKPPTKWEVYEQWLQIPYYVVFSREQPDKFQIFQLTKGRYHALNLPEKRCWFPEIKLGLGVWNGTYYGMEHQWLRWFDANGQWILTLQEQREQETQARLAEKQRADTEAKARLAEKQRADAEAKRANQEAKAHFAEKQRADAEAKRANQETKAHFAEKQRADAEAKARLVEKQRADAETKARCVAEAELIRLKALLAQKGLSDKDKG